MLARSGGKLPLRPLTRSKAFVKAQRTNLAPPMNPNSRQRYTPGSIEPRPDVDYAALAERVSYVGSPEHKAHRSYAGHPKPRAVGGICPKELSTDKAVPEEWLKEALRKGCVDGTMAGDFPKQLWYKDPDSGVVYEGYIVNRVQGSYKGYPIEPDQWPRGLDRYYP